MSALNVSGRCVESSGLTSKIHRPETSASWRAHTSLSLMDFLRLESATWISPLGFPSISDNSAKDIERPAPNRIASSTVESSGSDRLDPPYLGFRVELLSKCIIVSGIAPKILQDYSAIPTSFLLESDVPPVSEEQ